MENVYKPEEVLQIEMASRIVLNDALGRYVHDPDNLTLIQSILKNALADLMQIVPHAKTGCPPGYAHVDCSCQANIGVDKTGATPER